jgi:hypothetical protein
MLVSTFERGRGAVVLVNGGGRDTRDLVVRLIMEWATGRDRSEFPASIKCTDPGLTWVAFRGSSWRSFVASLPRRWRRLGPPSRGMIA